MASIFTKIIKGEIPSYKILEDDKFYAFLDINPLAEGHTLVVPKKEIDYFFDLDDELLAEMMIFAKKVAKAQKQAIECNRVGLIVIGDEVPHAHIHLIPFQKVSQMSFSSPKLKLTPEKMLEIQAKIQKFL